MLVPDSSCVFRVSLKISKLHAQNCCEIEGFERETRNDRVVDDSRTNGACSNVRVDRSQRFQAAKLDTNSAFVAELIVVIQPAGQVPPRGTDLRFALVDAHKEARQRIVERDALRLEANCRNRTACANFDDADFRLVLLHLLQPVVELPRLLTRASCDPAGVSE